MKKTYTLIRDFTDNYRVLHMKHLGLCGFGFRELFNITLEDKVVDVVVQTTKPRGKNYHVIDKGPYNYPVIRCETSGELEIFTSPVDDELDSFGTYPLYVSVYA